MFGLIAGFWKQWMQKDECQVLLIGLESAGKTTLLERIKADYKNTSFDPGLISRTIGMNMAHIELEARSLVFRDLGGMEGLRSLWEKYYSDSDVVVFVVDGVDTDKFEEARRALEGVMGHPDLLGVPVLVAVNKQDLVGSPMRPAQIMSALGVRRHVNGAGAGAGDGEREREVDIQVLSAFKGSGTRQLVEWVGGHRREKTG